MSTANFRPAFYDHNTCTIYLSRFPNGTPAPFHMLDGLPEEIVTDRFNGRVVSIKASIVSGFERNGYFYTRTAAAKLLSEMITREAI
jgi:hypothetical protein